MIRFCTLATTLLAVTWAVACVSVAGVLGVAFGQVFTGAERPLAGRLVGALLPWWGLVGIAVLLLLIAALIVIAWRQWRDHLRARSTLLILTVLAVAGLHAAAMSTIQVAAERRALVTVTDPETTPDNEQRLLWQRFQAAHRLSFTLFRIEAAFCALIGLIGAVVVLRDDGRG